MNYCERRDSSITYYFHLGLQQQEILVFLSNYHNITISERSLKRHLKRLNLYRRNNYSSLETVLTFLEHQIQRCGQLHGYRWIHLKCIQSRLRVKRETIRILLQILDPEGVSYRTRKRLRRRAYYNKGPNYLWHVDSYDKLKPYGICVNGCIDGFSRYVIWLKASYTSNDPKVISGYYIRSVKKFRGCPRTIRADMGTENGYIENMQIYLRQTCENDDTFPPFLYGTSQANQRIESWWSILRKHNAQFWMNFFETIKNDGLFNSSFLHKSLIQFCFMDIIQDELNIVAQEWNSHRISKSRNSVSASGRPITMYYLPELYNSNDYLLQVEAEYVTQCKAECVFLKKPCDKDVYDLCNIIMSEKDITRSNDPYEALNLYVTLKHEIENIL